MKRITATRVENQADEFWSEAVGPAITANCISQETCRIARNKEKPCLLWKKRAGLLA